MMALTTVYTWDGFLPVRREMKLSMVLPLDGAIICDWFQPDRRKGKLLVILPLDGTINCQYL